MTGPEILSIERTGEDAAIVRLGLGADHQAFDGHFPGQPVLPGVVQLDWAMQLAADCFGYEFRPAQRVRVKFIRLIEPTPAGIAVSLRYDRARSEVTFEYRNGDTVTSSGSAWLGG